MVGGGFPAATLLTTCAIPILSTAAFLGDVGAKVPSRLAPLKTYPAVHTPRGSEAALPNG